MPSIVVIQELSYMLNGEFVDMDCWEMDHTKRTKLGSIRDTFPSIRGTPNLVLQKRLHIW